MGRVVAALFVALDGAYFGVDGVEPWDEAVDARTYPGPHAVVTHPPCARWGRFWGGSPRAVVRKRKGDDGGCFAAAIDSVRKFGGVLEHPEASSAWRAFGLMEPPRAGGWVSSGMFDGGWTCCVEQGHYGHRARKATWLYVCGVRDLPALKWGPSRATAAVESMGRAERMATPGPFRDLLLSIARSAGAQGAEVRARSDANRALEEVES